MDTQNNEIHHKDIMHNDAQHNDIQQMPECLYAEFHLCWMLQILHAECRYAECHYAKCRGTVPHFFSK
jgi:hypothetical protein